MNIAYNHEAPETGDAPGRAGAGCSDLPPSLEPRQIDWDSLRSRLFAICGGTDVEGGESHPLPHLRGSFDGSAATALTTLQGSLKSVNPDGSSNGKSGERNTHPVADDDECGERGQR